MVYLLILVVFINGVACRATINPTDTINSNGGLVLDSLNAKTENSLTRLLYRITQKYFEGCDVFTYHDDKYEAREPKFFRYLYKALPLGSFIKRSGNLTSSKVWTYRPMGNCHSHMIFLDNIFTVDKIIEKDISNKILIVTESTPWTVKDFLKSYPARFYVNLLVICKSMSQTTKARAVYFALFIIAGLGR